METQEALRFPAPQVITSPAGFPPLFEALDRAEVVALDTETTGLDPRRDRMRLLSLATAEGCWLVDCFQVDPRPLFALLEARRLVGQNLLFDLQFLRGLGFVPGAVEDTLIQSHLLHAGERDPVTGERPRHGLDKIAARELDVELPKELQKSNWAGALTAEQCEYAGRDAVILLPLRERLRERLCAAGLETAAAIEHRCLPAVAWMAAAGAEFDAEAWSVLAAEAEAEVKRSEAELNAAAPQPPGLDLGVGWNWNSRDQVLRALREAGCDLPDTRDETLAASDHPLAALLRQQRKWETRRKSFGAGWLKFVEDGRIYAGWRQVGSEAGRMSCATPNLQQIPRDPRYRACIVAPPGRVLVRADFSQVELRIAAKLTSEQRMLAAYQSGADLHTLTAQQLLGREDVSKADRQLAKASNFGLLYGQGVEGFRTYARTNYEVEMTVEEAARYRAAFFRSYPGLAQWHRRIKQERQTETRTLCGRRRLLSEQTPMTHRLNTPVQGTGADGLKRALALLWERRTACPSAVPVIACHDEIVLETDAAEAEAAAAWLEQAMTDGMAALIQPVPVVVEARIGRTWAEM